MVVGQLHRIGREARTQGAPPLKTRIIFALAPFIGLCGNPWTAAQQPGLFPLRVLPH